MNETSIIFFPNYSHPPHPPPPPKKKKTVKCVHFGLSAEFYHKSYHRVTWLLSLFLGLFSMPSDLPP